MNEVYLSYVINVPVKPIDNQDKISVFESRLIEFPTSIIILRCFLYESLQMRFIVIDSMIPIKHDQRELIIEDKQTSKTAITTNTILNQQGKNVS